MARGMERERRLGGDDGGCIGEVRATVAQQKASQARPSGCIGVVVGLAQEEGAGGRGREGERGPEALVGAKRGSTRVEG